MARGTRTVFFHVLGRNTGAIIAHTMLGVQTSNAGGCISFSIGNLEKKLPDFSYLNM